MRSSAPGWLSQHGLGEKDAAARQHQQIWQPEEAQATSNPALAYMLGHVQKNADVHEVNHAFVIERLVIATVVTGYRL